MGSCISSVSKYVTTLVRRLRRRKHVSIRRVHHVTDSDEDSVEYDNLLASDMDDEDSDVPQFTKLSRTTAEVSAMPLRSVQEILAEERARDSAAAAALRQREEDLRLEEEAYIAEKRAAAQAAKQSSQPAWKEKENQDTNSIDSMVIPGTPVSFAASEGGLSLSGSEKSMAGVAAVATDLEATRMRSISVSSINNINNSSNSNAVVTTTSSSSNNAVTTKSVSATKTVTSAVSTVTTSTAQKKSTTSAAATTASADSDDDFDQFLESVKATSLSGSHTSLNTAGVDPLMGKQLKA